MQLLTTYKYLKTEGVRRGEGLQGGACRSETKYIYTIVPGSFAFMTPIPMVITILHEMTVPARREPIIKSFVLFSNSSSKRLGRPIFFRFWLFPLFLNDAFQEFMDVCLNVYFGYCFENLARASLGLWAKAYFPTSTRISFGIMLQLWRAVDFSASSQFPLSLRVQLWRQLFLGCDFSF